MFKRSSDKYNSSVVLQNHLWNTFQTRREQSKSVMTSITSLEVKWILCSYELFFDGKAGKEIPHSSKPEILEKTSRNNFALSDASRPLKRGSKTNLPLLRILLAVHRKLQKSSLWEMIDSFVLLASARMAALGTRL